MNETEATHTAGSEEMVSLHPALTTVIILLLSFVIESVFVTIAYYQKHHPDWWIISFISSIFFPKTQHRTGSPDINGNSENAVTQKAGQSVLDYNVVSTVLQTLIPTETEFSLPGFMQIDTSDYTLKNFLQKGGGGSVHVAEITNSEIIEKFGSSKCVIKTIHLKHNKHDSNVILFVGDGNKFGNK